MTHGFIPFSLTTHSGGNFLKEITCFQKLVGLAPAHTSSAQLPAGQHVFPVRPRGITLNTARSPHRGAHSRLRPFLPLQSVLA